MKLVYLAGPYSATKPLDSGGMQQIRENIELANEVAKNLVRLFPQIYPVIPHNNTREDWINVKDGNYFIEGTKELMRRCDCVFVLTKNISESNGTLGEIEEASRLGIPVFFWAKSLKRWLKNEE